MLREATLRESSIKFANLGFLALFPVFFFWHFALAADVNPLNIGLYGEVSALVALAFLSLFLMRWVNQAMRSPLAVVVLAFIIYCGVYTIFYVLVPLSPEGAPRQAAALVLSWFCLLSIGAFMDINRPAFQVAVVASWIGMALIVLIYLEGVYFIPQQIFDTDKSVASYQGFARSFVFSTMVLLAIQKRTWLRILLASFAIVITFFMAARSELIGLIFAVSLVEFIRASRSPRGLLLLGVVCLLAGLLAWLVPIFAGNSAIMESRQMQVLDLSKSTSWTARMEFAEKAWEQIVASPISGHFGGNFLVGEQDGGGYAHNALSCWVSFGIVGFLLYIGITFSAALISLVGFYRSMDSEWQLSLYLNATALLMILFAKSVFWPFVALGWGLCIAKSSNHCRMATPRASAPGQT